MRRPQRLIAAAVLIAFSAVLAGCSSSFGSDFDPTDLLEAEVSVAPDSEGFEVKGVIHAKLAQTCGVTLEPLPAEIRSQFSVRCREAAEGEPQPEAMHEIEIGLEDEDPRALPAGRECGTHTGIAGSHNHDIEVARDHLVPSAASSQTSTATGRRTQDCGSGDVSCTARVTGKLAAPNTACRLTTAPRV